MGKLFDKPTITYLGKVILIALLIVFTFRVLFFDFYSISTNQMESSLKRGDEILVSKMAYGSRLPITLLSIPFVDNACYSEWLKMPYKRVFSSPVQKNDIIVFNTPEEIDRPLDKRSLLISRCVAIPGDTVLISEGDYYLNSKEYVYVPTKIDQYHSQMNRFPELLRLAQEIDIPLRGEIMRGDTVFFSLNRYNAFMLKQSAGDSSFVRMNKDISKQLAFIIPSKGRKVSLTEKNIKIYRKTIESEMGQRAQFKEEGVYIDGTQMGVYTFQDNYYWVLSDNTIEGLDSRTLGFIPFKNVVGRAALVLYSADEDEFRDDRFFKTIN